jgi:hypothetical protein
MSGFEIVMIHDLFKSNATNNIKNGYLAIGVIKAT